MRQNNDKHKSLVRAAAVLLGTAVLFAGPTAAPRTVRDGRNAPGVCAMLEHALADSLRIKPGNVRKEVEKYFREDGGGQFPDNARYVWPSCTYLKLDVEYDPAPSRGKDLESPEDRVTRVSKLYVEYPTMD